MGRSTLSGDVFIDLLTSERAIAIVRTSTASAAYRTASTLLQQGFRLVEVSLTTPGAVDVIRTLVAEHPPESPQAVASQSSAGLGQPLIGAGTVLEPTQVSLVVEAGAAFALSPIYDPSIVAQARRRGLAFVPAAATPTEAVGAARAGAAAVKLFPASLWTPATLRDVLQALPDLQTIPTGGVRLADVPDWLDAGATAVGLGSALTRAEPAQVEALLRLLRGRSH